jgi:phosphatidylglycerol:prolipoprotein diacylglycerol transferase
VSQKPGSLTGEFLIIYSIGRIVNEFFREPDASLIYGMSRGQFYSLFLIMGGIFMIFISSKVLKARENC